MTLTIKAAVVDLRCDMDYDCTEDVAYIDDKGFAYCTAHGLARQTYRRCRKLRGWELRRLQAGRQLSRY